MERRDKNGEEASKEVTAVGSGSANEWGALGVRGAPAPQPCLTPEQRELLGYLYQILLHCYLKVSVVVDYSELPGCPSFIRATLTARENPEANSGWC